MNGKFCLSNALTISLIGALGAMAGCGSTVAGNSYESRVLVTVSE